MKVRKYSIKKNYREKYNNFKTVNINGNQIRLLQYEDKWVFPEIGTYMCGLGSPISISLLIYQNKTLEVLLSVTVNLPECTRNAGCQFIDTNNNPNLIKWLIDNNFGILTGNNAKSGYCTYPEFNFYVGKAFREYKTINDNLIEE